jgi:hypothetical protein
MPLPILAKVLIGAAVGVGGLALLAGTASADEQPTKDLPASLKKKVEAALDSADPVVMREVAKELEKAGFEAQAKSLRKAAAKIEKEMDAVPDVGVGAGSNPALPGVTGETETVRVLEVKPGDGPYQVAQRVGMAADFGALRDANIPRDGRNVLRESDGKMGLRTVQVFNGKKRGLEPGDLLRVPAHWPDHALMRIVELPELVAGDDDTDALRVLAGKVALEVETKPKGQENRDLIATFQRAEVSRGRELDTRGLYDARTALALAVDHRIVPPLRFSNGAEIYWPTNAGKARKRVKEALEQLASSDPQRAEEWQQAASQI